MSSNVPDHSSQFSDANPPATLPADPDGIPQELRDRPQWVCWRWARRDGRWTKVPVQPDGRPAKSNDPATWATFELAWASYERLGFAGLGYVFSEDDPYTGIDLDHVVGDAGQLLAFARLVEKAGTYAESSPSGTGLHLFVRGKLPGRGKKFFHPTLPDVAIETYDRGRYFTVTGRSWGAPRPIAEGQATVDAVLRWMDTGAPPKSAPRGQPEAPTLEDSAIVERASKAANGAKFRRLWAGNTAGYGSPSEADAAFLGILDFWTADADQKARLLRASGLYREKLDRADYVRRTIEATTGNGPRFGDADADCDADDDADDWWAHRRVLLGPFMVDDDAEAVDWLVEPVLLSGRVHLLYGEPENGKTIIVLCWLLECIARGEMAIFVDEEGGPEQVAKLLIDMGADAETIDRHLIYLPFPGLGREEFDAFHEACAALEPTLIVFDSLSDMLSHAGLSENSGEDVTDWMRRIAQRLARSDYKPAVVLTDHVTKDSGNTAYSVGSRAKKSKADVLWHVRKDGQFDPDTMATVTLKREKNRPGVLPPEVTYRLGGDGTGHLCCELLGSEASKPPHERALAMLQVLQEAKGRLVKTTAICEALGCKRDAIGAYGRELLRTGLAKQGGSGPGSGWHASQEGLAFRITPIVGTDDRIVGDYDAKTSSLSSVKTPFRGYTDDRRSPNDADDLTKDVLPSVGEDIGPQRASRVIDVDFTGVSPNPTKRGRRARR